jgi:hypothetical protein
LRGLANALVETLAFLDSAPAESIPRSAADNAMDLIASHLQTCTTDERAAVLEVVREHYRLLNESSGPEELIDFYENFEETFLGEE